MGFPRPSLGELITRAIADVSSRTKGSAYIKWSVERVLAYVQAAIANGQHGHFEWLVRQALPTTADIEGLLGWGTWLKVPRKGSVKAAGEALFLDCTVGVNVPAWTQLQTPDGILFETTELSTVGAGGVWRPNIRAVSSGSSGNLEAGAPLALVSPVAGVNSDGAVAPGGTTGGEDIEDREDYRPRVIDALRMPPAGGGTGDYVAWAREVPGVTRAWEFGNQMGMGTVSVGFVMDNREDIIPTDADVTAVAAHIESKRPLDMRRLYVQAPITVPVDMIVSVSPNTAAVRSAVEAELRQLFIREPTLQAAMAQSKVSEAISTTPGEEDHQILQLSSLDPGPWGLLTFGSVNFV